jgi:hypothetical protein
MKDKLLAELFALAAASARSPRRRSILEGAAEAYAATAARFAKSRNA